VSGDHDAVTEWGWQGVAVNKKRSNLGLHSGLPPFVSEQADREQLRQMPKASEPSIAALMVQRSKKRQAAQTSENSPRG
jgi:hypothetical protein